MCLFRLIQTLALNFRNPFGMELRFPVAVVTTYLVLLPFTFSLLLQLYTTVERQLLHFLITVVTLSLCV